MATSTLEALKMAVKIMKYNNKLIHHSDRGLQYCKEYMQHLIRNDIK
jgi:hypothetical protein